MDKMRLDGNAAAGTLAEVFSFEATTAGYACRGCGKDGRLGEAMVYEVRGLGIVLRCPGCDNALIRLGRSRGRYLVDIGGTSYIATG